jgi:RNA polymerase sigma-70 factor, ECF subfamily
VREGEFERLFDEHAQAMFAFLCYRTGDRAAAEDLLSETFERALRARRRFDRRRGTEKSWLYAIALNLLRDHARRQAAETRALERVAVGLASEAVPERLSLEDRDELVRALATLSDEEREAVALHFGAELSIPEIAKVTRERPSTIHGRVYRGLRKLRALVEG